MLQLTFTFGNDTYRATSKRVWARPELFLANNFERKKVVFSQVTVYKNNNQFRVSCKSLIITILNQIIQSSKSFFFGVTLSQTLKRAC